ncbi:S8 family serine peptidase [Archangium sp.]|uniref:S8 family serine peptidase n=1 Tax=Archangium sp. TaxID=1872627 RepID=UPI002D6E2411|nr:S8 family serine peptidase [Archangium sp.]HYO58414.1 S8 family serine peptidase [Archangium sp.]
MRIPSSSPSLARLLTCALTALAAACGDPAELAEPQALATYSASLTDSRPHYLYQGQPVYLDVEPTRLTVSGAREVSEKALRASLSNAGLGDARLERMPLEPNAFTVHLAKSSSAREAQQAAVALRREGRHGFVANVYRWQEDGSEVILHNRLVVRLKAGAGTGAIERLNRELGTQLLRAPQGGSQEYLLSYPEGVDPLAFAQTVGRRPEVEWVDPDKTASRQLHAIPSDPYFSAQYYARNSATFNGVRVDANVEWAWDLTYGAWSAAAGPFIVAVIDDGVEVFHPDLGSGSVLGYDAFTNSWSAWGCTDCATNPAGNYSHGTAVAGVIKAEHNNGIGLAGLAPAVKLLPIRIFKNGSAGSDSQIAMGIDAAWQNNAQVLSNSWGGGPASNTITAAINRATTQGRSGRGAVVVFSGGNTSRRSSGYVGGVSYPASLPNVIAVGAINRNGTLTDYSPEGSALDIVAPSGHVTGPCTGDVVTIDLTGTRGCNDGLGGNIDYSSTFSGTSAAAPQVSAVAAMVISRSPTLTEAQVRSQITLNADPWGSSTQFGSGKLNAYRALVGRTRVSISGTSFPSTPGRYTYTANASGGVGGYSYLWTLNTSDGYSYNLGTSSSVSVYVEENSSFTLSVRVTNGPDNQTSTGSRLVQGPAPCPPTARQSAGSLLPRPPDCPLATEE